MAVVAKTAAQLLGEHVGRQPDACALSFLNTERALQYLTFHEVWTLARGVAALVCRPAETASTRPVPEEAAALTSPVLAVAIDDGPYLAIAELGGWLAGCCITPVDPHDPVARVAGVLEEIPTLAAIVCKDWGDAKKLGEVAVELQARDPDGLGKLLVLDLSEELPLPKPQPHTSVDDTSAQAEPPRKDASSVPTGEVLPDPAEGAADPENIAYLWYTSGSTGKPKGCLIPHRAFSNWCLAKNAGHGIDSTSVVLIASASTFDPSIGDTFATWAVGGRVAVASRMLLFAHLGWVIRRLEVTHLTCTPSLWGSFEGAHPEHPDISSLRVVCLGGERMGAQLLQTWAGEKRPAGAPRLLNTYGTTECTVWQTLRELQPCDTPSRVGCCFSGNLVRIVEHEKAPEELACLEAGATGEILQGGLQVGLGYFRRPERSAASFLVDPTKDLAGSWYRTGDGGRLDPVHGLEVVGRFDNQVKVRGMRVELGDIEQAVTQAGARHLCTACCAVLRDGMIWAFVQLETETADQLLGGELEVGEHGLITEFLLQGAARLLPRHMLPSRFLLMRRFALGRTGKVDRKALPDGDGVVKLDRKNTRNALTKLERVIAAAWAEVLGLDASRLGPQDHFLALGGNSVSILRVSRRLTTQAKSQGAVVSPDGPVAFALAPERLIHSPRLQQYANVLEKAGMTQYFLGLESAEDAAEENVCNSAPSPEEEVDEVDEAEAAKELRINYTKLLVTERKVQAQAEAAQRIELDHGAWEQVPRTPPEDLLFRAASAGVLGVAAMLLEEEGTDVEGGIPVGDLPVKGPAASGLLPHQRLGLTPLHVAVAEGHEAVLRLLLRHKADPNRDDYRGCPALHKAAERGSRAIVAALIDAGANVWRPDRSRKFTALHAASKAGNVAAVESLLAAAGSSERGESITGMSTRMEQREPDLLQVYVNLLDRWNRTALHWTIVNAHSCCAGRLVEAGATVQGNFVEERGKLLIFAAKGEAGQAESGPKQAGEAGYPTGNQVGDAGSGTAGGTSKRAKHEAPEDPWRLAQEKFGEDGGPFCKILRQPRQLH